MNAVALPPSAIEEFIFGDPALHHRFSLAIELLARVMAARPGRLTTEALLMAAPGHSPRMVRSLLACLHRSGLLLKAENIRGAWTCPDSLGDITLADVFRSVSDSSAENARKSRGEPVQVSRPSTQQGVDLLLMQATMAINQVVLQHLQSFDLGRLQAVGTSAALLSFRARTRHQRSGVF
jgi:DNA-binding IscR family transcriptional regulator